MPLMAMPAIYVLYIETSQAKVSTSRQHTWQGKQLNR